MKIFEKIRFEYVFALVILLILSGALFVFKDSKEVVTTIITAMVGALSAITAFFFTKHEPGQAKEIERAPKTINPTGEITNRLK